MSERIFNDRTGIPLDMYEEVRAPNEPVNERAPRMKFTVGGSGNGVKEPFNQREIEPFREQKSMPEYTQDYDR